MKRTSFLLLLLLCILLPTEMMAQWDIEEPEREVIYDKSQGSSSKDMAVTVETFTVNGVSFRMIRVEGGTFQMGSNDSDAYYNEKPVHTVTLTNDYYGIKDDNKVPIKLSLN